MPLLTAALRLPPCIADGLLALLDDWDWKVRVAAVEALAGRDVPEVTDALDVDLILTLGRFPLSRFWPYSL
jgi:hypothetical protein